MKKLFLSIAMMVVSIGAFAQEYYLKAEKFTLAPGEEKGNYKYPHDYENHWVDQRYFPGSGEPPQFYKMKNIGYEAKIKEYWEKIKK